MLSSSRVHFGTYASKIKMANLLYAKYHGILPVTFTEYKIITQTFNNNSDQLKSVEDNSSSVAGLASKGF